MTLEDWHQAKDTKTGNPVRHLQPVGLSLYVVPPFFMKCSVNLACHVHLLVFWRLGNRGVKNLLAVDLTNHWDSVSTFLSIRFLLLNCMSVLQ